MYVRNENIWRLLVERHFAKTPVGDWAIECLELGYDSPSLRILASMSPTEWPSIVEDKLSLALKELGWDSIHPYVFLLNYARRVADDILSDRLNPVDGSREMSVLLSATDGHSELDAWYDIDEIIWARDYFERTGVKDEYYYMEGDELVQIIRDACTRFLVRTRRKFSELPETTFEEAEETFKEFLTDNGHGVNIRWIFAEDMIVSNESFAIREPECEINRLLAKKLYEIGRERNFGIAMHAFAEVDGNPYAYIIVPEDDIDAQYRLMGPDAVKFSVRLPVNKADKVTSGLSWFIRNLFVDDKKRRGNDDGIPFRP